MAISFILIALSLYVVYKGEINVTNTRRLNKAKGRLIGLLMVVISTLQYMFIDGPWSANGKVPGLISVVLFMGVIVLSYFLADKVPAPVKPKATLAAPQQNPESTDEKPEESGDDPKK